MVMRGAKRKGVRYFGPYAHAYAIRETLDLLLRTFPIRTCTKNKFDRHAAARAPVPLRAHREVRGAVRRRGHPRGVHDGLVAELHRTSSTATRRRSSTVSTSSMHEASDALEFERAARLRDQIVSVRKAIERQQMVDAKEEDYDAIGMVDDPLEASVQVFLVRKGRVVGRKGARGRQGGRRHAARSSSAACSSSSTATLEADDIPREILVPDAPRRLPTLRGVPRTAARRARCACACPQRGAKRAAAGHGHAERGRGVRCATSCGASSDHNAARARAARAAGRAAPARSAAAHRVLRHLEPPGHRDRGVDGGDGRRPAEALRLPALQDPSPAGPGRLRGDGRGAHPPVPSLPRRSATKARAAGKRFAYPPNLCSSTAARVSSASRCACSRTSGWRTSAWRSLAKRFEEVYLPGDAGAGAHPARLRGAVPAQQVRDEAHRFAITYHRQLRDKKMTQSVLDDVPGLGPTRRARLLKEHGSVKRLRELTEEELVAIPWLPEPVGHAVYAQLHGEQRGDSMTLDVTVITGMSGAGRSAAADVLEDLGFFVIDNLPPALIANVASWPATRRHRSGSRSSSTCARASSSTSSTPRSPSSASEGARTRVLFLDAVRRRARAPLRGDPPQAPARGRRPRVRRHRRTSARCSKTSRAAPTSSSTRPTSTSTSCATGSASSSANPRTRPERTSTTTANRHGVFFPLASSAYVAR